VLEGSVQRDQSRVRINAQLIDADSGAHIWADRFDQDLADLFKLQDEIVGRLANTLGLALVNAEAEKTSASKSPDAIDLALRGRSIGYTAMAQSYNRDGFNAARAEYEKALKIDPKQSDAISGLAGIYLADYYFWPNPDVNYDDKILGLTDEAIRVSPDSAYAYNVKSLYLSVSRRRFKESLQAADVGLTINPSYADLYSTRAHVLTALGQFEQAKADLRQAMLLSPHDPRLARWHVFVGDADFGAGNVKAATEEYEQSLQMGFHGFDVYGNLAAAYALQDRMEEAHTAIAEAERLNPSFTVKWYIEHTMDLPYRTDGLRKAGLPEG
jgi:adenylate cyclase